MADDSIASLLANAAKTNADFNFGKITDAYWSGLENAYKQRTRDAFMGPDVLGPDGQIDQAKVINKALRVGGVQAAEAAAKLFEVGTLQGRQRAGQEADTYRYGNPDQPPAPAPRQPASVAPQSSNFPRSTSSQSLVAVAPPSNQPQGPQGVQGSVPTPSVAPEFRPARTAGGDKANSIIGFLTAHNVPPEQMGKDAIMLSNHIGIDPNASLNPADPKTRGALENYLVARRGGQQQPQVAAAPQAAPPQALALQAPQAAPPPAPFNDRFTGGGGPQPQVDPRMMALSAQPQPQPQQQPVPQPPPQAVAQAPIQPRPVPTQTIRPPAEPVLGGVVSPDEMQRFGTWQRAKEFYERALSDPRGLPAQQAELYKAKLSAITDQIKFTEEQKAYEYEKTRNPGIGSFTDWKNDKQSREGRIKIDTATAEELGKNAAQIAMTLPILQDAVRLGKSAPGGMAGPAAAQLGRIMSALGMKVPETFSDAEALNSIAMRLLPLVRQPGAVSNFEQQSYMQALPSLLNTKEGRIKAAELMVKLARNGLQTAEIYRNNLGERDLYEKLAKLDKPVFSEEEKAEIERHKKAQEAQQGGGTWAPVPNKPGIKMRVMPGGQ